MTLNEIIKLTKGRLVCGDSKLNYMLKFAFASDLMSDVLTIDTDNLLLITGLTNLQTIRTAEMSDIQTVLFVRNKKVSQDMIDLANESDIALIECPSSMYKTCGELYKAGLPYVF
ncbi:MAG: hypothetical protein GVY19_03245 [Bacteroidetes bacterium]|nr:hypothetical protein [Bacteroidota bacterium]